MKSRLPHYSFPLLLVVILLYGYGVTDDKPRREWNEESNSLHLQPQSYIQQQEVNPVEELRSDQSSINPPHVSFNSAQRIILSEGFENGPYTPDSLPIGWTKVKVNPTTCTTPAADWRVRDSGNAFCGTNPVSSFTSKAYNSRKSMSIPWTAVSPGTITDDWVFTTSLNIETGDSLIFQVQLGTWPAGGTYYSDSLQVWVTSAQTPASQIAKLGTVTSLPQATNTWQERKFDLSSYNGQTVHIAFRYNMNVSVNGIMVNIDSVMVRNLSASPGVCSYNYVSQTSGTAATLYSVSAVDNMTAWTGGTGNTVRRTTDGGSTWSDANPGSFSFTGGAVYNIYAMDESTAFVTSSSATVTYIYKTTNGGTNWSEVYNQTGGFINAIQMISPLIGYAEGDPVGGTWTILTTVDGGNTWTRMVTEPTQVGGEAGWNNSFYVLGTNIWFGTNSTKVYRSTDLGLTWTSGATTGTVNTYGVHFNSSLNGVAGGDAGVMSTDGGATYSATSVPGAGIITGGITGGDDNIWVCRGSNIYRSSDNGATWLPAAVYTGAGTLWDADVKVSATCPVGWAVGATGQIVKIEGIIVGITNAGNEIPSDFSLSQNYPNPFNPVTKINFSIPTQQLVTLKVYDILGKEVGILVNEIKAAGSYIVDFNASSLSSGVYFYRLETENFSEAKRMMLLK